MPRGPALPVAILDHPATPSSIHPPPRRLPNEYLRDGILPALVLGPVQPRLFLTILPVVRRDGHVLLVQQILELADDADGNSPCLSRVRIPACGGLSPRSGGGGTIREAIVNGRSGELVLAASASRAGCASWCTGGRRPSRPTRSRSRAGMWRRSRRWRRLADRGRGG